jgi:SAM-dependent methyltransferase
MATFPPMQQPSNAYSGIDNLEVMQEAVNYNRYLLDTIRRHAEPAARILDFGAGTGQFAVPLHEQHFQVTALEPDASMSRRIAAVGMTTVVSTSELTPASFDLAYSLNVLEHIEDDVAALVQLHAVLKPAGVLLIYVPAFPILYTSMDAKVGHVRRYRRATLARAAQAAGFKVERLAYVDSLGFFATLCFKIFDRKDGRINRSMLKIYDRLVFPVSVAVDCLTRRWFGKNLLLVARKQ